MDIFFKHKGEYFDTNWRTNCTADELRNPSPFKSPQNAGIHKVVSKVTKPLALGITLGNALGSSCKHQTKLNTANCLLNLKSPLSLQNKVNTQQGMIGSLNCLSILLQSLLTSRNNDNKGKLAVFANKMETSDNKILVRSRSTTKIERKPMR